MYRIFIKRFFDLLFAGLAIILFSPLIVFIGLILLYVNNGKILFVQIRTGKNAELFNIYKFKTMSDLVDENNVLLPDKFRLHSFGNLLRKYSLDEIPQLFNVINGTMSIVGPRPLLPEYIPLYSEFQNQRHLVKPGITGWAQVNGRNVISWNEKFILDVWYVKNISFFIDCKILLKTILKVIFAKDINMTNHVSTEPFKGN